MIHQRAALVLVGAILAALLPVLPVWAAGATGEEEALATLSSGRHPLGLSGDGKWLLFADAENVLHRQMRGDTKIIESLKLGVRPREISVSYSGDKVLYSAQGGCLALALFDAGKVPRQVWLKEECKDSHEDLGLFFDTAPVALSDDGKIAAVILSNEDSHVSIIEAATGRVLYILPAIGKVLHLRFIDQSRKLLMVQAQMGEVWEGEAAPSDMQFAIWDLQSRALFNFHNTKTQGTLLIHDLLWHFSETTGTLWFHNTDGQYWNSAPGKPGEHPRGSIQPLAINLKQCRANAHAGPMLRDEHYQWGGFAADPHDRYLAGVITSAFSDDGKRLPASLWVRHASSGNLLAEWQLDDDARSLTPAPDGGTLYAMSTGLVTAGSYPPMFTGGGKLLTFDLSAALSTPPRARQGSWPDSRCMLEDETPGARDVTVGKSTVRSVFKIELGEYPFEPDCGGSVRSDQTVAWRLLPDGKLMVDRVSVLEKIDPTNGKVLQRLPTPRSRSVCALSLFERGQFLSWQGDTISLRPFAGKMNAGDRKILVRKPGWVAKGVQYLGDRIGVRWVNARYTHAEYLSKDDRDSEEGSAVAIEYDMSGKSLTETLGRASYGNGFFPQDDEGGEAIFGEKPAPQLGPYSWEHSYFGSIRARKRNSSGGQSTVFWAGLKLDDVRHRMFSANKVVGLGNAIGANVGNEGVNLYDALQRKEIARIERKFAREVAWDAHARILLLEYEDRTPEAGPRLKLEAFKID